MADVGFYVCAISSYERFRRLMAGKPASRKEADHEPRRARAAYPCMSAPPRQNWRELIDQHGTPLLVLDPDRVADAVPAADGATAGVRLHYAVKALLHPAVLGALAARGGSFDVATPPKSTCSGRWASRWPLYLHPSDQEARRYRPRVPGGIRTFVVDNPVEAQKFTGLPDGYRPPGAAGVSQSAAKSDLSTKFGVDPAEAELLVKHVLAAGVGSQASVSTSAARAHRRALPRRTARHRDLTGISAIAGVSTR